MRRRRCAPATAMRAGRKRRRSTASSSPAAASSVPPALVAQLRPGGCLVIPVGRAAETQHLQRIEKRADGPSAAKSLLPVAFVPLTRGPA